MNKLEVKNKLKDNKSPERWKRIRLKEVAEYEQPQKYIVSDERYDKSMGIPVLTAGKSFILGYTDEQFGICKNLPVIIFDDFTTDSRYINFPFKLKSSAIKILKTRNNGCNLFFIYNVMQNLNFKPGSGHKRFWISEYSKISILYPPLPEQQKIAAILETVDETIEKTDAIIEKYKRIKQGLMQDLLTKGIDENGQIRSEKTHRFKDSPLGRIPEEWEVVELGEVCGFINGRAFKPNEWSKGGLPIIRIENLNNINAPYNYCNFKVDKKYWISEGDLLLSWSGTPGTSFGMFIWNRGEAILNQHIFKVIIKKLLDKKYLYYKFNSMLDKMINQSHGSAGLKHITKSYLDKIKLAISVSLYEQQHIASILFQIDETIEKEQNYKEKLERIKQGLMEDLLTGKVRVNHLIKEGAESV